MDLNARQAETTADSLRCDSIAAIAAHCRAFAKAVPATEDARDTAIRAIADAAGKAILDGHLAFDPIAADSPRIQRLHKEAVGPGTIKLQLFALDAGEAHPPHAHHDLLSCQIVVCGNARVKEYDLLNCRPDGYIEIGGERVYSLLPGDGVTTLAERNNVHWQEGLVDGTLLLNINWQGFLGDGQGFGGGAPGRRGLLWDKRRPAAIPGRTVVPTMAG